MAKAYGDAITEYHEIKVKPKIKEIKEDISDLKRKIEEGGEGGGISGSLAKDEQIEEIVKSTGVYLPDNIVKISLATEEQIDEMFK